MTSYTTTKTSVIDYEIAQIIHARFVANKKRVCTEILATVGDFQRIFLLGAQKYFFTHIFYIKNIFCIKPTKF